MKFTVEEEYIGTRLDKYIRKKYSLNLKEIFKLISNGKIQVNFKKQRQNYRLEENDVIYIKESVDIQEKTYIKLSDLERELIESSIVYEDDRVIILNKEADMVMHKGSGHEYGLSEMMKSYLESDAFTFVNRIDRATSGLIIGSKDMETTRELSELIAEKEVIKKYYILVDGTAAEDFEVVSYLLKDNKGVREYDTRVEGSKESTSYFKVVKTFGDHTLLEGTLGSGRTHQLRVQLANKGLPIVGDMKYGKKEKVEGLKMHLFSHEIIIEKYNLHINLPVPGWFIEG